MLKFITEVIKERIVNETQAFKRARCTELVPDGDE